MALRTLPIRRAGNRDNLVLGGDRELVMAGGLAAFALVFTAHSVVSTVTGVGFWVVTLFLTRRMAASDPKLRYVYLRHRGYRRYYAARSTPSRRNGTLQARRYR